MCPGLPPQRDVVLGSCAVYVQYERPDGPIAFGNGGTAVGLLRCRVPASCPTTGTSRHISCPFRIQEVKIMAGAM